MLITRLIPLVLQPGRRGGVPTLQNIVIFFILFSFLFYQTKTIGPAETTVFVPVKMSSRRGRSVLVSSYLLLNSLETGGGGGGVDAILETRAAAPCTPKMRFMRTSFVSLTSSSCAPRARAAGPRAPGRGYENAVEEEEQKTKRKKWKKKKYRRKDGVGLLRARRVHISAARWFSRFFFFFVTPKKKNRNNNNNGQRG